MKKITVLFIFILLSSCAKKEETVFSEKALKARLTTVNAHDISFQELLDAYPNKKIVLNIWASWCKDCIKSLPENQKIYEKYASDTGVVFVHISIDRSFNEWKNALKTYKLSGEQYFLKSGWDGDFGNFLQLDWIPRYLVIGENRQILVFNAITLQENVLDTTLKK